MAVNLQEAIFALVNMTYGKSHVFASTGRIGSTYYFLLRLQASFSLREY
jgi:hypothetical protein